jgi:hypothetical protein
MFTIGRRRHATRGGADPDPWLGRRGPRPAGRGKVPGFEDLLPCASSAEGAVLYVPHLQQKGWHFEVRGPSARPAVVTCHAMVERLFRWSVRHGEVGQQMPVTHRDWWIDLDAVGQTRQGVLSRLPLALGSGSPGGWDLGRWVRPDEPRGEAS